MDNSFENNGFEAPDEKTMPFPPVTEHTNDRVEAKPFYDIDFIFAIIVGLVSFLFRFLPWYSFFVPEKGKFVGLNERFGPFTGSGAEKGLRSVSEMLVMAKWVLIASSVVFVIWLAFSFVPKLQATGIPAALSVIYYVFNFFAVVLGFMGAVGGTDVFFALDTTIDIGLYGCLVSSLVGLMLAIRPRLASSVLKAHNK